MRIIRPATRKHPQIAPIGPDRAHVVVIVRDFPREHDAGAVRREGGEVIPVRG